MTEGIGRVTTTCKLCRRTVEVGKTFSHLHHIIPRMFGGTDKDGRVTLCIKCHDIIHKGIIPKTLWELLTPEQQEIAKKKLKSRFQL